MCARVLSRVLVFIPLLGLRFRALWAVPYSCCAAEMPGFLLQATQLSDMAHHADSTVVLRFCF